MVAMAAPGGLVWPRLITGTPGGSLGGEEEPPWPTSSNFGGPGEAGFGGGAGTRLGAHTILAFSVMVGPTSAWASGGHMDPEGVLTCGRNEASGAGGGRCHPQPLAQQSKPSPGGRLGWVWVAVQQAKADGKWAQKLPGHRRGSGTRTGVAHGGAGQQ